MNHKNCLTGFGTIVLQRYDECMKNASVYYDNNLSISSDLKQMKQI